MTAAFLQCNGNITGIWRRSFNKGLYSQADAGAPHQMSLKISIWIQKARKQVKDEANKGFWSLS